MRVIFSFQPRCPSCHRMISMQTKSDGRWIVECRRKKEDFDDLEKVRAPSYCPMRMIKLKEKSIAAAMAKTKKKEGGFKV